MITRPCIKCRKPFQASSSAVFCSVECAFWDKVEKGKDCWLWRGVINDVGYGQFNFRYRKDKAHRVSWELHKGPITRGRLVVHRCENPACVNPNHLTIGGHKEKMAQSAARGTAHRGAKHYKTNLSEDDVRAIRSSGDRGVDLAKRFNTTPVAISLIRSRKTWKHVT